MKRNLLLLLVGLFWALSNLYSQPLSLTRDQLQQQKNNLQLRSTPILKSLEENKELALKLAKEKGWTLMEILPGGELMSLQGVDQAGHPIYYITDFNTRAAATISTQKLWPGGAMGLNLNGSSAFMHGKLAIWDGGSVLQTHQEFADKIQLMEPNAILSNHATHVAGTMVALGINPYAKGMAFGATLLKSWDFNNDTQEISEAAFDLLVSNHSYGTVAGWSSNSNRAGTAADPRWEWRGHVSISTDEDYKFGYYDTRAQMWDMISYYSPYYLMVKSSGNNRNVNGPAVNEPFWRYDAQGTWELVPARPASMSSNNGYDIISTYGNAKNILTVGAVNPIENGYKKAEEVVISNFSSWGPTDDGRIKPDIVANGVSLYSAASSATDAYTTLSGTSMSAPNASGSLFLLQEHYHKRHNQFMRSSTLRGLVCHTADEAGNPGPDYIFGWGLMNTEKAAHAITNHGTTSLIEERSLTSGATITLEVTASGKEPLVVTIAWTDPEAEPLPLSPNVLNNRTPRLINDLDLRISDGTQTFLPWILNPEVPSANATKGDNFRDNIEQVVIANPVPGKTYTLTISHKGAQLIRGPQVFSIIATGIGGNPACTSAALNNADMRINRLQLNTINNPTAQDCQTYRDFTQLNTRLAQGSTYPLSIETGTCGDSHAHVVKVYADWNANGSFEEDELIYTSDVLQAPSTLNTEINIPTHTPIGANIRLRVVLQETEAPQQVNACGTYAKGETQDYTLIIDRIKRDIALNAILGFDEDLCGSQEQFIQVRLENLGQDALMGFQLKAKVLEDNVSILDITETFPSALGSLSAGGYIFTQKFATLPAKEYKVEVSALLDNDLNPENNQLSLTFQSSTGALAPEALAVRCEGENRVLLSSPENGLIYWYDKAQDGNLLAAGNASSINAVPASGKVWAGLNTLSGSVGPKNKDEAPWTGGGYSNFAGQTFFQTSVPLVIKSTRLHVRGAGEVTFQIEDLSTGQIISMVTLFVTPTENTMDNTDPGRIYPLNLEVPKAGQYRMRYTFGSGTSLYRANGQSSNPYPYSIPNVISFYGTNQTNPTGFYYYMYDMQIGAKGCSADLLEVEIQNKPKPVIDLVASQTLINGQIHLDAGNAGSQYLWNTGETTQTIAPKTPGQYTVKVTNPWGCSTQTSIILEVTAVENHLNDLVKVYPNPSSGDLFVETQQPVRMELFNLSGQKIWQYDSMSNFERIDLSGFDKGIYFLRLTEKKEHKIAVYKIVRQ